MKKIKAKWAALLAALSCFAVCLGVGAAKIVPSETSTVTASAETIRTIDKIGATNVSSATVFYVYDLDNEQDWECNWDYTFTFTENTGDGIKLNGEPIVGYVIKHTGRDIYFELGERNISSGDVLTLDGTFYSSAWDKDIIFDNSALMYNGSTWVTSYYVHYLGSLAFNQMGNENKFTYLKRADGEAITAPDDGNGGWTATFTKESGVGITLNNNPVTPTLKFPGSVFLEFGSAPSQEDILVIGGTFVNEDTETKYVIEESKFQWTGTEWENYVTYKEYEVNELTVHIHSRAGNENANNTTLWLWGTGDESNAWAYYTCESGVGVQLNGEALSCNMQDFGNGLYLKGFTANEGDYITIGGTFVNKERATKYVISESHFQWNGSGWVVYTPPVVYEEYTLSNLRVADTSKAGGAYVANNVLSLKMSGGATTSDWPWFVYESGAGLKVNGESANLTGGIANAVQDTNGGLYFQFAGVNSGDVVSIGGTFINADLKLRYIIPESKFQWNGSEWVEYVEYDTQNIGALALHNNGGTATTLYLQRADGEALPVLDWDHVFTFESGDGWKVNGVSKALSEMKSTRDGLYLKFEAVPTNATVSISGTFVYSQAPVKYVITESKFVWTGSAWEKYVEYTTHNVGNLTVNSNSVPGAATAVNTSLYLIKQNGSTVDDWTRYTYVSGDGFKVNGQPATLNALQNVGTGLYLAFAGVNKGDVISISGTYKCVDTALKYEIDEAHFTWTGAGWIKCYADNQLAAYDSISLSDLGYGVEKNINTTVAIDNTGLSYTASAENTTGSVKFRFGFNAINIGALTEIRLRGTAWQGIRFIIGDSQIKSWYSSTITAYALSSNTDYLIELGAIDLSDGQNIWIYAKVDGIIVISDVVAKTATNPNEDGTPTFDTFNTNNVSIYFNAGVYATLTDPDHVSITYTSSCGSTVDYVEKNSSYTILPIKAKTYDTFIGWTYEDMLYRTGNTLEVGEDNVVLEALEIDFRVQDGAAIRIAGDVDSSGIRFTTIIKEEQFDELGNYGIADISYGTLIIPYDYLGAGQAPNLSTFTPGVDILQIQSNYAEANEDGYIIYRGAMKKLYEENYERLFAGRGYMQITLESGEEFFVYTPFDKQDNVRSIRQVAQAFQVDISEPQGEDEIRYGTLSDEKKAIVDVYAAVDAIDLMDYAAYAANNFLNVIAWNYPKLDESNNYNNTTNENIATQMKNTGIRVVNLTGLNLFVMDSKESIEKTRQIINFFWSQGLQTVAFSGNAQANVAVNYTQIGMPDFSDCEGFIGFLHWDEPTGDDDIMAKLADLAIQFNNVYAGSDVTYMNNLLPAYSPIFQKESSSIFGSSTTLEKAAYKAYVEEYCTTVLSEVKGQKWLSVDSYPINKDYSLHDTFLFDLGVIKYYAMQYDAHAHVALQSSGFGANENAQKARIPTEAEMRMQAYAAMAFGMDSISWFTYSPSGSSSEKFYTFVDNEGNITNKTAYEAFTNVNKELAAIGAVYSAFDWKGVILGAGNDNTTYYIGSIVKEADDDYNAFAAVSGQIGDYQLNVGDTKHLSSVDTNEKDWNYLMSVMQDANGNEGYVLCNYNSHEENRAQTITITFNKNITEVVIYGKNWLVDGKPTTVNVSNQKLTVDLATGEGVIILPSKLG